MIRLKFREGFNSEVYIFTVSQYFSEDRNS